MDAYGYVFKFSERALRPNRMYWRQGIYLNWSPEAYCLVGSEVLDNRPESFLKITVPSCRKGKEVNLETCVVPVNKHNLKDAMAFFFFFSGPVDMVVVPATWEAVGEYGVQEFQTAPPPHIQ